MSYALLQLHADEFRDWCDSRLSWKVQAACCCVLASRFGMLLTRLSLSHGKPGSNLNQINIVRFAEHQGLEQHMFSGSVCDDLAILC